VTHAPGFAGCCAIVQRFAEDQNSNAPSHGFSPSLVALYSAAIHEVFRLSGVFKVVLLALSQITSRIVTEIGMEMAARDFRLVTHSPNVRLRALAALQVGIDPAEQKQLVDFLAFVSVWPRLRP
jgi:hypothetical protein